MFWYLFSAPLTLILARTAQKYLVTEAVISSRRLSRRSYNLEHAWPHLASSPRGPSWQERWTFPKQKLWPTSLPQAARPPTAWPCHRCAEASLANWTHSGNSCYTSHPFSNWNLTSPTTRTSSLPTVPN